MNSELSEAATIARLAVEAAGGRVIRNTAEQVSDLVILDAGQSLHSLEPHSLLRNRMRGRFLSSSLPDFAAVVEVMARPKPLPEVQGEGQEILQSAVEPVPVFVDPKKLAATAIFNLGDSTAPGHCDHTAALQVEFAPGWATLLAVEGKPFDQKSLVHWLEDWSDLVPDAAGLINAVRKVKVAATNTATHAQTNFEATRSTLESVEATSVGGTLPEQFAFVASPADGLTDQAISIRLAVHPNEPPSFTLRIVARQAVEQRIAQEFKALLEKTLGTTALVIVGTYTP